MRRLLHAVTALVLGAAAAPAPASDGPEQRILVVRERNTAELLGGAFTFRVLKIRGYSIDLRIEGAKHVLRLGQSFSPAGHPCTVVFEEISPETRIARFLTDCPAASAEARSG